MTPIKYRLKRTDRASAEIPAEAEFCYSCNGSDYGCANDDSRSTGIEHTSVTLKEDGAYPCFTIPKEDLEKVEG